MLCSRSTRWRWFKELVMQAAQGELRLAVRDDQADVRLRSALHARGVVLNGEQARRHPMPTKAWEQGINCTCGPLRHVRNIYRRQSQHARVMGDVSSLRHSRVIVASSVTPGSSSSR